MFRGFYTEGVLYAKGGLGGAARSARRVPGAPPLWVAPAALLGGWQWPRGSGLVILESSVVEIFNIIFLEFFVQFNPPENLKKKNNTGSSTENSVSPG